VLRGVLRGLTGSWGFSLAIHSGLIIYEILVVVETLEGRAYMEKLGHWGMPLKGIYSPLTPSSLCLCFLDVMM
jgi:hypothetical protein